MIKVREVGCRETTSSLDCTHMFAQPPDRVQLQAIVSPTAPGGAARTRCAQGVLTRRPCVHGNAYIERDHTTAWVQVTSVPNSRQNTNAKRVPHQIIIKLVEFKFIVQKLCSWHGCSGKLVGAAGVACPGMPVEGMGQEWDSPSKQNPAHKHDRCCTLGLGVGGFD